MAVPGSFDQLPEQFLGDSVVLLKAQTASMTVQKIFEGSIAGVLHSKVNFIIVRVVDNFFKLDDVGVVQTFDQIHFPLDESKH